LETHEIGILLYREHTNSPLIDVAISQISANKDWKLNKNIANGSKWSEMIKMTSCKFPEAQNTS
jgi:hypothetical protein